MAVKLMKLGLVKERREFKCNIFAKSICDWWFFSECDKLMKAIQSTYSKDNEICAGKVNDRLELAIFQNKNFLSVNWKCSFLSFTIQDLLTTPEYNFWNSVPRWVLWDKSNPLFQIIISKMEEIKKFLLLWSKAHPSKNFCAPALKQTTVIREFYIFKV